MRPSRWRQRSGGRNLRAIVVVVGLAILFSAVVLPSLFEAQPSQSARTGSALDQGVSFTEGEISTERNFYIVVDGSGSMTEGACAGDFPNRVEAAKWAVTEFVAHSVPAGVNLGLLVFDGSGNRERVPLGKDRERLLREIERISGSGGTPLNQAIREGAKALSTQKSRQLGYGEFYVVVATDGAATDGPPDARDGVQFAAQAGVPIITIGFCLPGDHALASQSLTYRNANNPEELLRALTETQGEVNYFDQPAFDRR